MSNQIQGMRRTQVCGDALVAGVSTAWLVGSLPEKGVLVETEYSALGETSFTF